MDILTLGNLLPYVAQVVCVAILATAISALLRVDSAAVRYIYWRAVLALSLALPLFQPLHRSGDVVDASAPPVRAGVTAGIGGAGALDPGGVAVDWTLIIFAVLILGALARLAWIATGLYRLQQLRRRGRPMSGEDIATLQQILATRADVRVVEGLRQPATFGFVRPIVLLPEGIAAHPAPIQRALLAHELVHVQRRDWFWVICEELLLAVFWFNPATWWIIRQVRCAREEAVDEVAVLATGSRRTYVQALLAFAGDTTLTPAPSFAHRRHLFRRILLISTEAAMSSTRIVLSSAAMAIVLVSGGWYSTAAFPLIASESQSPTLQTQGPGPIEKRANPVSAENPVPKRTDYQAAEYPMEARHLGLGGAVTLRVTLDEVGRVVESRRTGFSIRVANPQITASFSNTSTEAILEQVGRSAAAGEAQAIVRALDALTASASHAVSQWRYEPPKNGPIAFDIAINFRNDGETNSTVGWIAREPSPAASLGAEGAVRVGGNIKAPTKTRDVRPVYPPEAQAARVSGMVIVEARVGADGSVEAVQVLRSIPLLDQAAVEAVRQWKFTPTLLNGVPVPVIMTMTVNFTLQ